VESESELPYAGLHQLLRSVAGELDGLAPPQADALRAAFGLRVGRADERFLVSLAVLSLLGELSERRPVLCVVDDAHWLDRGSVDALAFVARRLEAERVALVLAVRDPAARAFPVTDLPALPVGPLDSNAVGRLLERHGGGPVHPDVRLRLETATGGNALALAELARTLSPDELSGAKQLPEPLPLTAGVEQAFLDRVRRLPAAAQTALLGAAADNTARAGDRGQRRLAAREARRRAGPGRAGGRRDRRRCDPPVPAPAGALGGARGRDLDRAARGAPSAGRRARQGWRRRSHRMAPRRRRVRAGPQRGHGAGRGGPPRPGPRRLHRRVGRPHPRRRAGARPRTPGPPPHRGPCSGRWR
jgi:hypothetical protein